MIRYCFIIPRTPKQFSNPLREALWEICKRSLIDQHETSWVAYVIGNKDLHEQDDRFIYIEHDVLPKQDKIRLALNKIKEGKELPDYVLRLDDDDTVSDSALSTFSDQRFDCLYDKKHTFYEICTGKISRQSRYWLANTVAHKFEHAVTRVSFNDNDDYLLCMDHSKAWHEYYKDKLCISTESLSPLYMRILSPFTITSKAALSEKEFIDSYKDYLLKFGAWSVKENNINGFDNSFKLLRSISHRRSDYDLPALQWPVWGLFVNRIREYKSSW